MSQKAVVIALLTAAAAIGTYFSVRPPAALPPAGQAGADQTLPAPISRFSIARTSDGGDGVRDPAALTRQIERLKAVLEAEAAERQRLAQRLEAVEAQLSGLQAAADDSRSEPALGTRAQSIAAADTAVADQPTAGSVPPDDGSTPVERALVAAGLDPLGATEIKRRRDELTLAELSLRDQATREQWLDAPRFQEEMAQLDAQRISIRDEVGDDGYDRYLAALGEPNRVRVAEVLSESPAAAAGFLNGDVVLQYGDMRIFSPDDLVGETRAGNAGESVRVTVLRQGQRIEIDVPRGPLGLRIAASQGAPDG